MADKILTVDNLKISFRTRNGNVQAVRNISFDLNKGETLSIVGESGSGKSVTSRAILGILAQNAIVESGRIIYNGQDLLKIDEEHFHKIRGDKIAMIFQDPMSSLNPIMRIGKQLTEAMVLKNKASRKRSRNEFNSLLKKLNYYMDMVDSSDSKKEDNKLKCQSFDKFEYKHLELEGAYNIATEYARDCVEILKNMIFHIEKNALENIVKDWSKVMADLPAVKNHFLVDNMDEINKNKETINANLKEWVKKSQFDDMLPPLRAILAELENALAKPVPNFFSLGYYLTFENPNIPEMSVEEMNQTLHEILDKNFMLDFISRVEEALKLSREEATKKSLEAHEALKEFRAKVEATPVEDIHSIPAKEISTICRLVRATTDALDIYNSSPAYTFNTSIYDEFNKLEKGHKQNIVEEKRFKKEDSKYQRILNSGKTPSWKPAPKSLWDLEMNKKEILQLLDEMISYFEEYISPSKDVDYNKNAIDIIDYLKEKASNVVYRVTKRVAQYKAIKLMEEVGIPEPEKRFRQYPFQFSGGMRQRIVIAIALAANPDILICDEPTTALDVTIQSQILELINDLKKKRNLSIIFITHNLGVVANMADRIAVMYAGKIVEIGTAEDIFYSPAHPYTWALLSSMPDLDTKEKLEAIPGTPPNMIYPPVGDAFAARNKYALKIDFEQQPPFFQINETHKAATWLLHPSAPTVKPPKIVTDRIERMKKKDGELHGE